MNALPNNSPRSISVVIPVFNAEQSLGELLRQLIPALSSLAETFEVILVEDSSQDGSWEVINKIVASDQRVRGVRLSRNYGQHNALLCGIRLARYDIIVTMDDDLQHPVSEIGRLLEPLTRGCDVVYGAPEQDRHDIWRNLASRMTKLALQGASGTKSVTQISAFRAFPTRLRAAFADYRSPTVSIDVLLTWATSRFAAVTVQHAPRIAGQSNYTVRKLVKHAFNLMTGFSTLPLQLASVVGFVSTLFGLGVLAWGRWPLLSLRIERARLRIPRVDHRHFLWRADVRTGRLRRIPGAHLWTHHGAACVHSAGTLRTQAAVRN